MGDWLKGNGPGKVRGLNSIHMKPTIYPIKAAAPYRIAIVARPRGGDWLCDELQAFSREGIDVLVSMLTQEEAEELGLKGE